MIALYPKTVRWKVTSTHFGRNMDRWQIVRWSQVKTSRQDMSCGLTCSHVHVHVLYLYCSDFSVVTHCLFCIDCSMFSCNICIDCSPQMWHLHLTLTVCLPQVSRKCLIMPFITSPNRYTPILSCHGDKNCSPLKLSRLLLFPLFNHVIIKAQHQFCLENMWLHDYFQRQRCSGEESRSLVIWWPPKDSGSKLSPLRWQLYYRSFHGRRWRWWWWSWWQTCSGLWHCVGLPSWHPWSNRGLAQREDSQASGTISVIRTKCHFSMTILLANLLE